MSSTLKLGYQKAQSKVLLKIGYRMSHDRFIKLGLAWGAAAFTSWTYISLMRQHSRAVGRSEIQGGWASNTMVGISCLPG